MNSINKIAIASDHAGFTLKEYLKQHLKGVEILDFGPTSMDSVDYPDYAEKVANAITTEQASLGILVCGSGIGVSIAANRFSAVRAAHVESEISARLSRAHNDANVLCLGARIIAPEYALNIVEAWLKTPFEGARHERRVQKLSRLGGGQK